MIVRKQGDLISCFHSKCLQDYLKTKRLPTPFFFPIFFPVFSLRPVSPRWMTPYWKYLYSGGQLWSIKYISTLNLIHFYAIHIFFPTYIHVYDVHVCLQKPAEGFESPRIKIAGIVDVGNWTPAFCKSNKYSVTVSHLFSPSISILKDEFHIWTVVGNVTASK